MCMFLHIYLSIQKTLYTVNFLHTTITVCAVTNCKRLRLLRFSVNAQHSSRLENVFGLPPIMHCGPLRLPLSAILQNR